ncbi:MAG: amidase family protein, partial [Aestuariivirgaceae bacterium]
AGYVVEEIEPPGLARSTEIIQQIADTEMTHYLPGMLPMMSEEGQSYLQTLVADMVCDLPTYMNAIAERHRIARDWSLFMQRYPLVLGPVSAMQPFKTGYDVAGSGELKRFIQSIKLTEICNLLGLPGIAVPVGVDDGLPQGVQLVGPRFHEDLCFDAAEVIEQHCGVLTPVDPAMSQ